MAGEHDPPLDLAATLRAVGAVVEAAPVVDAMFFHRTLARWLGLPEGKVDSVGAPVQWNYRYWKAELRREPDRDGAAGVIGAAAWCAELFSTADGPVEVVRWWVKKDDRGRISEAGWHGTPPRVLEQSPAPSLVPTPPDPETLARLFAEDDH